MVLNCSPPPGTYRSWSDNFPSVKGIYWAAGLFLRTPFTEGCAGANKKAAPLAVNNVALLVPLRSVEFNSGDGHLAVSNQCCRDYARTETSLACIHGPKNQPKSSVQFSHGEKGTKMEPTCLHPIFVFYYPLKAHLVCSLWRVGLEKIIGWWARLKLKVNVNPHFYPLIPMFRKAHG